MSFTSFVCLITVARTSSTMSNKSDKCGHPCLILDIGKSIQPFTSEQDASCRFFFFPAMLDLHWFAWAFFRCGEQGLLFIAVPLTMWLLLLWAQVLGAQISVVAAGRLENLGSIVVLYGLSCSTACGIFLDQGSNLCLLHRQADFYPLCHQENPAVGFL